jgi:hypothetical protein
MADAPELDDPVRLAVILDVPAGRADGWRFTGRGPRWARMGGVLRYRTDVSQPGSLRSGMCRPGGPIDESGKSTGAPLSNGWRREANGKPSFLWLNCG